MKEFWHYNKKIGIETKLGNTNTDDDLSKIILNFLHIELNETIKILEPAVGSGSFYFALLEKLKDYYSIEYIVENILYAYDIDEEALSILKNRLIEQYHYQINQNTKIFHQDFLLSHNNIQFDYIITNPPYISYRHIKNKKEFIHYSDIDKDILKTSDLYIYFYIKCMKMLKNNGKMLFLCSDTWIDAEFGNVLKKYLTETKEYNLDYLINSQLYPFFRDDTNAIITIISKTNKQESIICNYREYITREFTTQFKITKQELKTLFEDETILNKRNALVLFFDYYHSLKHLFNDNSCFIKIKDEFEVQTTSESFSKLNNKVENISSNHNLVIFWQPQARVNRKPNYKNFIKAQELPYQIENPNDKNIKNKGIYLSNVIDRFPLVFNIDYPSYHVSKYFYLKDKNIRNNNQTNLKHILLNNIFTFLNMELELKEGTRKTLRKGEYGLAKEINKKDLMEIKIPNINDFSEIKNDIIQYSNKIIYNIEDALKDNNYLNIQLFIAKKLNFSKEQTLEIIKNLLFLYLLRMRNIEKITHFEEYFKENYLNLFENM